MAEAFSKGLDRNIRYEPLPPDKFGEILGNVVGKEAGQMMAGRYQMIFDNPDAFSTNIDMAPVLDKLPFTPTPLEDWVRQNKEVFSEPVEQH